LVADELEGEVDQDRREGGEARPLCCLPDGRGRHRTANVPRDAEPFPSGTSVALSSAIAGDPMADAIDATKLLDVQMDPSRSRTIRTYTATICRARWIPMTSATWWARPTASGLSVRKKARSFPASTPRWSSWDSVQPIVCADRKPSSKPASGLVAEGHELDRKSGAPQFQRSAKLTI